MNKNNRGFTLIELLVVVAIISLISSVVLSSLALARAKARDATRLQNLREVRTALEVYRNEHGAYPITGPDPTDVDWSSASCPGWTIVGDTSGADGWVPGLAPQYMKVLPLDPRPIYNATGASYCYIYISDGADYMLMAYRTVETFTQTTNPAPRPNYSQGASYQNSFAFYTPGARTW